MHALQPMLSPLGCQMTRTSVRIKILPARNISGSFIYDYTYMITLLSRRYRRIFLTIHPPLHAGTAMTSLLFHWPMPAYGEKDDSGSICLPDDRAPAPLHAG